MSRLGERAVVIGAGMGGIAAAGALAGRFDNVVLLERDALPSAPEYRLGAPQGRHVHALLAAGQRALEDLYPGFTEAMVAAGAVATHANSDTRVEMPGFDPFPQRDLGWITYCLSRPLIEFVARRQAEAHGVVFHPRSRARSLELSPGGDRVAAVVHETDDGMRHRLPADLVVDASGRATLTLALLEQLARPAPEETVIGVDFAYATAVFDTPADAPADWKILMTMPGPTGPPRGGLLAPMEGGRWIVSLGGRGDDKPPEDWAGFLDYARGLRTTTLADAIDGLPPLGEVVRYGFRRSVRRHFDRLAPLPHGLVPLGDSLCRFNPVYGQGMTVAAQEAVLLRRLLDEKAGAADPIGEASAAFITEVEALIEGPWRMSAIPDLAAPQTEGERPADLGAMLLFGAALVHLAARDPEVHKLDAEVRQLLKPPSALMDPALMQRVMAMMGELTAQAPARAPAAE